MNKLLLSLLGYSGSIGAILATATMASPDAAKTIPYPQVVNLKQVPRFDHKGIIQPSNIAKRKSAQYLASKKSVGTPSAKVTNLTYQNLGSVAIGGVGYSCPNCGDPPRGMMMRLGT